MNTEQDEAARRIAERSISEVASALGVQVDATMIVSGAEMLVDVVKGGTWKRILSEGDEAASKINTLTDAVKASRERK